MTIGTRLLAAAVLSSAVLIETAGGVGCRATDTAQDAPIGWWTMDEQTGTVIPDASGHGNAGSIEGNVVWSDGKIDGAIQLDGEQDSIIRVENSESLRGTANGMTAMAWAYRTGTRNAAVITHGYPDLFLGFHGPQFKWQIRDAPDQYTECNDGDAAQEQWLHLAGTYDGSVLRLFVNGAEICSQPRSGPIPMSDAPFLLSGYLNTPGSPDFDEYEHPGIVDEMNGKLDDVRVYDHALAAKDIKAIYDAGVSSSR